MEIKKFFEYNQELILTDDSKREFIEDFKRRMNLEDYDVDSSILKDILSDLYDFFLEINTEKAEYEVLEKMTSLMSLSKGLDRISIRYKSKLPWVVICSAILYSCSVNRVEVPKKYRSCDKPSKFSNFAAGFKEKNVSQSSKKRLSNYRR